MSASCHGCSKSLGFLALERKRSCAKCENTFCSTCLGFACSQENTPKTIQEFCEPCYRQVSNLDMSRSFDSMGPEDGRLFVFVHGGGGNRNMFAVHARALAEKGFRCVLLDLPGHGALVNEPLSLDSAIERIIQVTRQHIPSSTSAKPIYIGASLGGYIGMEFLGRHPDVFERAVIAMCGQNVGKGRSMIASLGLFVMSSLGGLMSPATLLQLMMNQIRASGHIADHLVEEMVLRCGFFFQQSHRQIEILRASDPLTSLPNFAGPILFINGSMDHRDSELKWVQACQAATLKVYEGGDHFFSHDDRYLSRFIEDLVAFAGAKE